MEQKIFYARPGLELNDDIFDHRDDKLNAKMKELNSMGWKVENIFNVHGTGIYGFVCTKIN